MGKTIFVLNSVTFMFLKLLELKLVLVFPLNSIPGFTVKKSPWTHETVRESNLPCKTSTKHRCFLAPVCGNWITAELLNGAKYRTSRLFRKISSRKKLLHQDNNRGLLSWTSHQWTASTLCTRIWVMVKGRVVAEMIAWWKTVHPWLLRCSFEFTNSVVFTNRP